MSIQITYYGHSCFVAASQGYRVAFDPYDSHVPGYGPLKLEANEVICSHEHGDHAFRKAVKLIPGGNSPFETETYEIPHDDCGGQARGMNQITVLKADGLKVIHFGDIGCLLPEELAVKLDGADAVMLPVGGFFTIDAGQALAIYRQIHAKVMIPMHYRAGAAGFEVIGSLDDFEKTAGSLIHAEGNTLEITPDMTPQIVALQFR